MRASTISDEFNQCGSAAAARALGTLGPPAVPGLRRVIEEEALADAQLETAQAAIAALSLAGRPGVEALVAIKRDHPNQKVKKLAALALGSVEMDAH